MSDNTQLNVMSGGDIIQTEDFGTAGKIERVKLVLGNKDVDNGDVSSTNALPTNDASLNIVQGTTTDAAVVGDINGSVSAKLRGISKIFNSVWNSTVNFLKVGLYFSDGTAVNQSGGNVMVNVGNFATGSFGNTDGNAANLTSALTFSEPLVFNGTSWDRLKGDSTNGAYVNLKANPLVTSPLVGQAKIAVTGTAVQLASHSLTNGVIITAKSTNAAPITIGISTVTNTVDGTGSGYILEAGAAVSFAVSNTNDLYINGTAGDIVSFAGS